MEPNTAGSPDPADVRRRLARGRGLRLTLDEAVTYQDVADAARALKAALGPDVTVFPSGLAGGRGLTVLQLLSDAEVAAVRPDLDRLVAEFRHLAAELVTRMKADTPGGDDSDDHPESVHHLGATWSLSPHGEHCRFENDETGVVVEAQIDFPDRVDPYFLLMYAETSGRYGRLVEACVEGFHDMCRLLDTAGITHRT